MTAVLDALEREVERVGVLLDALDAAGWRAPTRCAPMTVKDMTAHMLRGSARIIEMVDAGALDEEPEKDAATYFRYDAAKEAPAIVARAQEAAEEFADVASIVPAWRDRWARAFGRARACSGDPVLPNAFGNLRLTEYLKTRVIEVAVHHMDILDALGREADPDPAALEVTADVLRVLLGTDARPLGISDVRFVLIGTGRAPLSVSERELFGPLAEGFPLLA